MLPKYNKFNPNPFGAHMKILNLVGKNKVVLDVGCSTGQLAKRLKEKGCKVYGIEIDEDAAKIARKYCEDVIVGDVESLDTLPHPESFFDIIVFADILEHLKNPYNVLINLKRYLKDGGYILCSIPNVAHIYVRLNLLFGRWNYEDIGLLDRTHLRFFTIKSARKLIEDAGFKIEKIDFSPWIPLFRLRKFRYGAALEYYIAKLSPTLFASNLLTKARKVK